MSFPLRTKNEGARIAGNRLVEGEEGAVQQVWNQGNPTPRVHTHALQTEMPVYVWKTSVAD